MAKKKVNIKDKSRKKPKRRSWWTRLFHFIMLPPVRRLILIVLIVALLYGQRSAMTSMTNAFAQRVSELFDWGLVFFDIILLALVIVLWRRKLSLLVHHWNQWGEFLTTLTK